MAFLIGLEVFTALSDPINDAFFEDDLTEAEKDFQAWAYGVWGATMVGWGILLYFVVRGPFAKKEPWSWHAIALGVLAWFAIDTGFSAYHGVTINVLVNIAVLVLAFIPQAFSISRGWGGTGAGMLICAGLGLVFIPILFAIAFVIASKV